MNQIGFEAMTDAGAFPVKPVMFVAGDDEAKKPVVIGPVNELGFEAVGAGPLRIARLLEPFAMLWIHMVLTRKVGRDRGFAWVRRDAGGMPERDAPQSTAFPNAGGSWPTRAGGSSIAAGPRYIVSSGPNVLSFRRGVSRLRSLPPVSNMRL
jgi:hypothetical protein